MVELGDLRGVFKLKQLFDSMTNTNHSTNYDTDDLHITQTGLRREAPDSCVNLVLSTPHKTYTL